MLAREDADMGKAGEIVRIGRQPTPQVRNGQVPVGTAPDPEAGQTRRIITARCVLREVRAAEG